jgi:putative heme transporter
MVTKPSPLDATAEGVPRTLRIAANIAWRLLLVGAALVVVAIVVARLRLVFLPVVAALFLATVLAPPTRELKEHGLPDAAAAIIVLLVSIATLVLLGWGIALPVTDEFGDLDTGVRDGVDRVGDWLVEGPLGLEQEQIDRWIDRAEAELRDQSGVIAGGVVTGTLLVVEVIAGGLLTLVLLFFFLKDGERMWAWGVALVPEERRGDVHEMGVRAWMTLSAYLRGVAAVGLIDAVFIGLALWLLGVPLVLPLAVLTFFGGFFPIVGATLAGFAAVMVALVSNGLVTALLVLGAVLLVQQLEGNLLQPVIVGRSVKLHPVVVLLALVAGGVVWGLIGAFIAVPLTAVVVSTASYLYGERPLPTPAEAEAVISEV